MALAVFPILGAPAPPFCIYAMQGQEQHCVDVCMNNQGRRLTQKSASGLHKGPERHPKPGLSHRDLAGRRATGETEAWSNVLVISHGIGAR